MELILSISCPVSCYPWSSYVLAKDCVSTSLANNGWAAASQLPNMTENERKSLLLAKLSFHYNRTVHTEFELSNRKVRKSTCLPYKLIKSLYCLLTSLTYILHMPGVLIEWQSVWSSRSLPGSSRHHTHCVPGCHVFRLLISDHSIFV